MLFLSSFPNRGLNLWCVSNNILRMLLNSLITSAAKIFLLKNGESWMALYFLINPPLIFQDPVSCMQNSSDCGFWYYVALISSTEEMTNSLALCSAHCENELSQGMLNVSLILVHLSFTFIYSASGYPKSVSKLSPNDILSTRLTKFSSFIYYLYVGAQQGIEWARYTL